MLRSQRPLEDAGPATSMSLTNTDVLLSLAAPNDATVCEPLVLKDG